jgi:hypothetical protein
MSHPTRGDNAGAAYQRAPFAYERAQVIPYLVILALAGLVLPILHTIR